MLKKEYIKQLEYATALLSIIKEYALDEETKDFYDKTGITTKDLTKSINQLIHIYSEETVKHLQQNKKSNEYNKTHPEKHIKHNADYAKRHPDRIKARQKKYYEKRKGVK